MAPVASKYLGKYELVERLGRGGMAEVYRAYQASLERYVAIKLLHPFLADDPEFKERFEREARNVARLRHPNIVQVYDFDYDAPSESYYMVMELVDGQTLKDRLGDMTARGEHQSELESLRIARDAASAMGYAHERGVIHRDVKPPNLIFDHDGRVVLTDFGIAKIITGGTQLTASGTMVGTPAYMSPEQGLGEKGDERSDLYSLGVIMFQMVTGRLPYDAESPLAVILKHVNEPIPPIRELAPYLSPGFEAVIYKAMAKLPAERYQTADALIRDLEAVVPGDDAAIPSALTTPVVNQASSSDSSALRRPGLTPTPIRRLPPLPTAIPNTPPSNIPPIVPPMPPGGSSTNGSMGSQPVPIPAAASPAQNNVWRTGVLTLAVIILIGAAVLILNGGKIPAPLVAFFISPTPIATITPTASPTDLPTATPIVIADTATSTATNTSSPTASPTPTLTVTPSPTFTDTATPTLTVTPSSTITPSNTATLTPTATVTPSPTASDTLTPSDTLPPTLTPTTTPNITATLQAATQAKIDLTSTSLYATVNALALTANAQNSPTPNYTETAIACNPQYRLISPDPAATPQILKANIDVQISLTLLNTGDCDWLSGTSLRFDTGNDFSAPLKVTMQETTNVQPGQQAHFIIAGHTPGKGKVYTLSSRLTINPGDRQVDPPVAVPIRVYEAS